MANPRIRVRKIIHPDDLANRPPELTNEVHILTEYLDDLGNEVPLRMDEVATFAATSEGVTTNLCLRVHEFFFENERLSYLLIGSCTADTKRLEGLLNTGDGVYLQVI